MGIDHPTPWRFQADVMNGVDPSPQDVSLENGLLSGHRVTLFWYNQQFVDSLTASIRLAASNAGVPVVGVSETMPTPGYDDRSWMEAEVRAIDVAVDGDVSTRCP
jgi:zinc/manganese transport system substrate-binding protein